MPLLGRQPQPGDLIWFQRVGYQHWAVYVGNNEVIHLTLPGWVECVNNILPAGSLTATVQRERLSDVAGYFSVYGVGNQFDSEQNRPLRPEEIVRNAERLVGLQLPYNFLTSNCEHFATMMRYGVPQAGQASLLNANVDQQFVSQIRQRLLQTRRRVPRPSQMGVVCQPRTVNRWFQRGEEL